MAISSACTVEIAFGVSPFDDTSLDIGGNWTDVTSSVRSVQYQTSTRSDRFSVFSAGTCQVVLSDLDREFDPSNSGSTYAGQFLRSTPIRIIGVHSSTDYVQWCGYVRLWTPGYDSGDAVTNVDAVDGLGLLARYEIDEETPAVLDGSETADHIDEVLDRMGWPTAYRDLDPTGTSLTGTEFGVNALAYCHKAALSDGGVFYHQPSTCALTFDGLAALTETRQVTSQATLTGYLLSPAPRRSGVGEGFRNLVSIGGPAVTNASVDNVGANGAPVSYSRTDLLMDQSGVALGLANFYADLFGTETPYTETISYLAASASNASANSALFTRLLRDRVTVTLDPPGGGATISDELLIDGISGEITPDKWAITFLFSSADAYDDNLVAPPADWFVLDTDLLGTGKLGY